ncbi:uncharacterized protein L969DRAFT_89515 [Mixia osmundae IAM 14324]|uniref:protein-tyrosine-phosphatase n=1 Tax=Mixia osmundae (strain CBS 9802 / IAM 14324 / JCM 22182 / KY 12970) TaxID=764103 RepID=G7DS21_MIXOS|nr:uncharacterized protein L969DRAFT_89515 [Mixia osmundae IAM 14324]KEI37565.1 hypothetical protein L969DRAFT_89515 [Mixia osmundae IAM 14324]GAA93381.1 hypothetical protein E5Q_00021 [Mixia osmundae IAM 14324]
MSAQSSPRVHMHEVIPGLFIGDLASSQNFPLLREHGIHNIISAMKQRYVVPEDFAITRIAVDDNNSTDMISHFKRSNEIIRHSLNQGHGILVHCQAGVSRSTTLVAAFLMSEFDLEVEEAIARIQSVRTIVEPTEFFMGQLELYERCECDADPAKYAELRRFLMHGNVGEITNGDGVPDKLYLAYFPSPAPSPRPRSGSDPFHDLRMTSISSVEGDDQPISRKGSITPQEMSAQRTEFLTSMRMRRASSRSSRGSKGREADQAARAEVRQMAANAASAPIADAPPPRRTFRSKPTALTPAQPAVPAPKPPVSNVVNVGQDRSYISGRRLRCRMCRRELASREFILTHEPGVGQQAFAPHRRDMTAYRAQLEELKLKEKQRLEVEQRQRQQRQQPDGQADDSDSIQSTAADGAPKRLADRLPANLANLRVSLPPVFDPTPPGSSEGSPVIETPSSPPLLQSSSCSAYFVEPLSWMSSTLEGGSLGGKLACPNARCNAKLGSFDWSGAQCGCGAWVVPGFALQKAKVDEVRA